MKRIQFNSKSNFLKLIFTTSFCFCFWTLHFAQLPQVNNSTSSGNNQHEPCNAQDPIPGTKTMTVSLVNDYTSEIAISSLTNSDIFWEDLSYNWVTSVSFSNNGYTYTGLPKWNSGETNTVTITFAHKIRSTRQDGTFSLGLTMIHQNLTDKVFREYSGSACFVGPTIKGKGKGDAYSSLHKTTGANSEIIHHVQPSKDIRSDFAIEVQSGISPLLILSNMDNQLPASVYIVGLTNQSYRKILEDKQMMDSGINKIPIDNLPTGIYQIIVAQGSVMKTIKYAHIVE